MTINTDLSRLSSLCGDSASASTNPDPDTQLKSVVSFSTNVHRGSVSWVNCSELEEFQEKVVVVAASTGLVSQASPSIDTLEEFPRARFVYDQTPIGEGSCGKIYCGQDVVKGRPVAIKVMGRKFINSALQEWEVGWAMRENPHVPDVYGLFKDKGALYLVQELINGVNLKQWLTTQSQGLTQDLARHIFKQVVEVVLELHRKNIMHRDIKAANILIADKNKISLVDFGSSASGHCRRRSFTGTPATTAPETVGQEEDTNQDVGYDVKVDSWSLGILLFELLTGGVPFAIHNRFAFMSRYESGEQEFQLTASQRDLLRERHSTQACDLICAMLAFDPKVRIGADEVLAHPWFHAERESKGEC